MSSPAQAIGWGAYTEEVFEWRQPLQPRGKISRRQPDGVVEINLGSKDGIQVGTTLNVLPADFPEKGRQSRMRSFRVPDEKSDYQTLEKFVPKAKIEVIEVLGPDQSRARITEEFDDIRERVVTGDLLYATDYQPEDLKPISRAPAGGLFQGVASLAFAPDGKALASAFCNFRDLANTGEASPISRRPHRRPSPFHRTARL